MSRRQQRLTRSELALSTARLLSVVSGGVVAQIVVDMPGGYFGAQDEITRVGIIYSAAILAVGFYLAVSRHRGWPGVRAVEPVLFAVNAGLFAPAMASDPVVSSIVLAWNIVLFGRHFFARTSDVPVRDRFTADEVGVWCRRYGAALRHLAIVALGLTVAIVGYRLSDRTLARLICLSLHAGTLGLGSGLLLRLYRAGSKMPALVLLALLLSLITGSPSFPLVMLATAEAILLVLLMRGYKGTEDLVQSFFDHPSRLVVVSFAILVAIGSIALTFPATAGDPAVISPIDALFTATSSACVTGLIVLDTPSAFSPLGHVVILCLIQVGGLGIMVLSTFGTLLLGGTLGLRGERALSEMLELTSAPHAYRLTRFIVVSSLAIEGLGAAILTVFFHSKGVAWDEALWKGVFHAISAFCNAGFALQNDSLISFQEEPVALLVIASLVTFGGLGFIVLANFWWRLVGTQRGQLNTQVRAVLAASAVLTGIGCCLFLVLEWHASLDGLGLLDKLTNALFQSVTLRTAGFNSVDFTDLAAPTILFMMGLMFIGASPGSTGGGIKTTTVLVLLAAIRATISGGRGVRIFDREIPQDVVQRSLAIAVISALLVSGGFFVLLIVEPQPFLPLMFESVSAFATVGLSLGATPALGPAGKLAVTVGMFLGRVGPLTLALFLATGTPVSHRYRLPDSRLMVG